MKRRKLIATFILLFVAGVGFSQNDNKEGKVIPTSKEATLEWENLKLLSELKRNQAANLLAQADDLDRQANEKISEIAKALKLDESKYEALFNHKTRQLYFKQREKKANQ